MHEQDCYMLGAFHDLDKPPKNVSQNNLAIE